MQRLSKHYSEIGVSSFQVPNVLFEVRLEIRDVRSGHRSREGGLYWGEWLEDPELVWTRDLVHRIDPASLREVEPPRDLQVPEGIEEAIARYFVNTYRVSIWRNPTLGLYSLPSETESEFRMRCATALAEEGHQTLSRICDLFLRQFLEVEQRRTQQIYDELGESEPVENYTARLRESFLALRDDFARLLLRDGLNLVSPEELEWSGRLDVPSEERMEMIRRDFLASYNEQVAQVIEKANDLQEYEVPLNRSQVEVISTSVLWLEADR